MSTSKGIIKAGPGGAAVILIMMIVVILAMLQSRASDHTFYDIEKECLIVESEKAVNCYTTPESYAMHEGLHVSFAKEKWRAYVAEAEKREEIRRSVDSSTVYKYPLRKSGMGWVKEKLKQRHKNKTEPHHANQKEGVRPSASKGEVNQKQTPE